LSKAGAGASFVWFEWSVVEGAVLEGIVELVGLEKLGVIE